MELKTENNIQVEVFSLDNNKFDSPDLNFLNPNLSLSTNDQDNSTIDILPISELSSEESHLDNIIPAQVHDIMSTQHILDNTSIKEFNNDLDQIFIDFDQEVSKILSSKQVSIDPNISTLPDISNTNFIAADDIIQSLSTQDEFDKLEISTPSSIIQELSDLEHDFNETPIENTPLNLEHNSNQISSVNNNPSNIQHDFNENSILENTPLDLEHDSEDQYFLDIDEVQRDINYDSDNLSTIKNTPLDLEHNLNEISSIDNNPSNIQHNFNENSILENTPLDLKHNINEISSIDNNPSNIQHNFNENSILENTPLDLKHNINEFSSIDNNSSNIQHNFNENSILENTPLDLEHNINEFSSIDNNPSNIRHDFNENSILENTPLDLEHNINNHIIESDDSIDIISNIPTSFYQDTATTVEDSNIINHLETISNFTPIDTEYNNIEEHTASTTPIIEYEEGEEVFVHDIILNDIPDVDDISIDNIIVNEIEEITEQPTIHKSFNIENLELLNNSLPIMSSNLTTLSKEDVQKLMKEIDNLLEFLPDSKIEELAQADFYYTYLRFLDDLGV